MPSSARTPLPSTPNTTSSLKRKAMSITQTYFLAHTARGKLSSEAARGDHNLRLLVGHANLLDSLMLELAEAEQEQESWFNQSVKTATSTASPSTPRHIQWADAIVEEPEEDWQAVDTESDTSDSGSEFDEDEEMAEPAPAPRSIRRAPATTFTETVEEFEDEEEFEDDGEEDYAMLSLTRTHSRSPPELSHDDSESEDESMPPSPPSASMEFSETDRKQIATTSLYSAKSATKLSPTEQAEFYDHGFYLAQRGISPSVISAISVY